MCRASSRIFDDNLLQLTLGPPVLYRGGSKEIEVVLEVKRSGCKGI